MKTRFEIMIRRRCWLFLITASASLFGQAPLHAVTATTPTVAFATQLEGVQHGTYAGRDYLTLKIGDQQKVGPLHCRSNMLRLDVQSNTERRDEIEAIALSAMLSSDVVVIVLQTGVDQCLEGRPAFTDIYPLPVSL